MNNAELTIYLYPPPIETHPMLGPGNDLVTVALCVIPGSLAKRRDVDVRFGVDRDLKCSTLVTAQGTNQTENPPRRLLYRSPGVPVPEKTIF